MEHEIKAVTSGPAALVSLSFISFEAPLKAAVTLVGARALKYALYWMDTSVDEVVFLRPLIVPLSQDVESGRVREQRGEDRSPKA